MLYDVALTAYIVATAAALGYLLRRRDGLVARTRCPLTPHRGAYAFEPQDGGAKCGLDCPSALWKIAALAIGPFGFSVVRRILFW